MGRVNECIKSTYVDKKKNKMLILLGDKGYTFFLSFLLFFLFSLRFRQNLAFFLVMGTGC